MTSLVCGGRLLRALLICRHSRQLRFALLRRNYVAITNLADCRSFLERTSGQRHYSTMNLASTSTTSSSSTTMPETNSSKTEIEHDSPSTSSLVKLNVKQTEENEEEVGCLLVF